MTTRKLDRVRIAKPKSLGCVWKVSTVREGNRVLIFPCEFHSVPVKFLFLVRPKRNLAGCRNVKPLLLQFWFAVSGPKTDALDTPCGAPILEPNKSRTQQFNLRHLQLRSAKSRGLVLSLVSPCLSGSPVCIFHYTFYKSYIIIQSYWRYDIYEDICVLYVIYFKIYNMYMSYISRLQASLQQLAPDIVEMLDNLNPPLDSVSRAGLLGLFQYSEEGKKAARDFSFQGMQQLYHATWRSPSAICKKHVTEKWENLRNGETSWRWAKAERYEKKSYQLCRVQNGKTVGGGFLLRDFGILLFPPPVSMTGVSPHLLFVLASAFTKAMVQNIKLERNCSWPQSESQSQSSALHPCRLWKFHDTEGLRVGRASAARTPTDWQSAACVSGCYAFTMAWLGPLKWICSFFFALLLLTGKSAHWLLKTGVKILRI